MSFWSTLFPSREAVSQRQEEEREIMRLSAERRQTLQVVQSSSRVMRNMAGAMQIMARENRNEDR